MKKILSVIAIAIFLFSCNNSSTSTPSGTVTGFFEAAKKADENAFKSYLSKDDLAFLIAAEGMAKQKGIDEDKKQSIKDEFVAKAKDASFKVLSEKIEGDKATVEVEVKDGEKTNKETMNLIKEDGKWKLSLFGGMKDELQKALSSMGDIDSLKNTLKDINFDTSANSMKDLLKEAEKHKDKFKELQKMAEEYEKSQK